MARQLFIILLLISIILVSGCIHKQAPAGVTEEKETTTTTPSITTEEQAISEIEQEMEQAIEGITTEDIEKALTG
jgi:PBP1b-binding outer membrane lipoprotein LpoB